jgi:two-component system NtrC family response regulator
VLAAEPFDLVLQDMNFSLQTSGQEGLDLLARIKERQPQLPVLLMTAWGSIGLAVKGVQAGAANFFTKPWDNLQLAQLVGATLQAQAPSPSRVTRTARRSTHSSISPASSASIRSCCACWPPSARSRHARAGADPG